MITIATLKAAGLTAEQIVAVLETGEQERLAKRREQNRLNQANKRQRDREAVSNVITVSNVSADADDSDDANSALSLLPSESQSPKEERKKERAKRESRRDRGHVCPDDFSPSEVHLEAGLRQGLSRQRVVACCEAMKAWSKSNANRAVARKVDWSAALHGWISREVERAGKANGNGHLGTGTDIRRSSAGDRARELAQLAREREVEAGIVRPPDALGSS